MTETKAEIGNVEVIETDEATFERILEACGDVSLQEKITLLHLTIDYVFRNNKQYAHLVQNNVVLH